MKNYRNRIILGFLGGYMAPPVAWLASIWYFGVVTPAEVFKVILFLRMYLYILVVVGASLFILIRNLRMIERAGQNADGQPDEEQINRRINFIPKFFMLSEAFYCLVGPVVVMSGADFLTLEEFILSALLGIPLILLFSVPFFTFATISVENFAHGFRLNENRKFMGMLSKIVINTTVTITGIIVLFMLFFYTSHRLPFHELRDLPDFNDRIIVRGLTAAVLVLGIGVLNIVFLGRQILQPITSITDTIVKISREKDFSIRSNITSRDQIGFLNEYLNRFVKSLNQAFQEMKVFMVKTGQLSRDLTGSSVLLAESSRKIQSTMEKMETGSDGMNLLVEKIRESSADMEHVINKMGEMLEKQGELTRLSDQSVREMTGLIAEIIAEANDKQSDTQSIQKLTGQGKKEIDESIRAINEVSDTAQVIMDMMMIINDIAEKTNLLAMNAAIEAAHAGESGKGFSVVAGEIRKLSETTRNNSKKISDSLRSIIEKINSTALKIRNSEQTFNHILDNISGITGAFLNIGSRLNGTADQTSRVTASLLELTRMKTEITEVFSVTMKSARENVARVQEINQISRENLAGIRNAAGLVEEISGKSQNLSGLSRETETQIEILNQELNQYRTV